MSNFAKIDNLLRNIAEWHNVGEPPLNYMKDTVVATKAEIERMREAMRLDEVRIIRTWERIDNLRACVEFYAAMQGEIWELAKVALAEDDRLRYDPIPGIPEPPEGGI